MSDGQGGTNTATVDGSVAAQADDAILQVSDAAGREDAAIPLDIRSSLADADGSETLELTVNGVPEDAVLSAGVDQGDGSWTLQPDELDGLTVTPAGHDDTDFTLTVTATTREADGDTAGSTDTITVNVDAVADAPELSVTHARGFAGESVPLDIRSGLTDMDGSERLEIRIAGLPQGASLNVGVDHGGGTWVVPGDELEEVSLELPDDVAEDLDLRVTAIAMDSDDQETPVTQTLRVQVDSPELDVEPEPPKMEGGGPAMEPPRDFSAMDQLAREVEQTVAESLDLGELPNSYYSGGVPVAEVGLPTRVEPTDWQHVDFGHIREVREAPTRTAPEPAVALADHSEGIEDPEEHIFTDDAKSHSAGRPSGVWAWIWSLFRAHGGVRNEQPSERRLMEDERSTR